MSNPPSSSTFSSESPTNHYCLSIQSHVVHGYVGNRSATFPLQLLGIDVDVLNTVQLATHTGYPGPKLGTRLTSTEVETIQQGLRNHSIPSLYSSILTGYIPSAELFQTLSQFIQDIRKNYNSQLLWLCDPVLGDNGKLYMPASMIDHYKQYALPYATILTPNQFEAEQLTGIMINDYPSIHRVFDALHCTGVDTVIITSSEPTINIATTVELTPTEETTKNTMMNDYIYLLASCPWDRVSDHWNPINQDNDEKNTIAVEELSSSSSLFTYEESITGTASNIHHARFGIRIPRIPDVYFTGTGDLIASLILGFTVQYPHNMVLAIEKAVAAVYSVCQRTIRYNNQLRTLTHLDVAPGTSNASASSTATIPSPLAFSPEEIHRYQQIVQGTRTFTPTDSSTFVSDTQLKVPAFMELRLVQSKKDIENPPIDTSTKRFLRAEKLSLALFEKEGRE